MSVMCPTAPKAAFGAAVMGPFSVVLFPVHMGGCGWWGVSCVSVD